MRKATSGRPPEGLRVSFPPLLKGPTVKTRFFKYHGLGNDFVVIDRRSGGEPVTPEQAIALCDRRRGIGADGVLTLLPGEAAPARMHVTNADGSIAEMCGNGLRCAVKYLGDLGGIDDARFIVETGAGPLVCEVVREGGEIREITVDMGRPELVPGRIPMRAEGERFVRGELQVEGDRVTGTAVSMGNPHLVLFDAPRSRAEVLGPALERHEAFPQRTNVEFVDVVDGGLDVLVWERGCGFTHACGTGACASMVAAVLEGHLPAGEERPVRLTGGLLHVRVAPDLSRVHMRGPAAFVFAGEIAI